MKQIPLNKVLGCLAGVAIGDAIGMPSAGFTPEEIRSRFGEITCFLDAPHDHPLHSGLKAAQVTDDTELTLLVADMIVEDRRPSAEGVAKRIVEWAARKNLLSTNLLGPSTARAIRDLMQGKDPRETGKFGTTNGSAMKIAPIGIVAVDDLKRLATEVEETCRPTHWTSVAISGACSIAFAINEALRPRSSVERVLTASKRGAAAGAELGRKVAFPSIEKRIELALKLVSCCKTLSESVETLYHYIGSDISCVDSIPTVIGLFAAAQGNFDEAVFAAANMGGDTDTIGSMVGALCGAFRGIDSIPPILFAKVEETNHLDLEERARALQSLANERAEAKSMSENSS
jgi:ADP-ribosylglycohydrolase